MPINKKAGEKKSDFINRCIGVEVSSGMKPNQAVAVCNSIWEELKIKELNKKRKEVYKNDTELLKALEGKGEDIKQFGLTADELNNPKISHPISDNEHLINFADVPDGYEVRYKYIGPLDEKNRPFCRAMMTTFNETWFSRSDIEALNTAPGKANRKGNKPYSVFNWRGGNWCRHTWRRFYFNITTGDFLETPVQPNQKSTTPK